MKRRLLLVLVFLFLFTANIIGQNMQLIKHIDSIISYPGSVKAGWFIADHILQNKRGVTIGGGATDIAVYTVGTSIYRVIEFSRFTDGRKHKTVTQKYYYEKEHLMYASAELTEGKGVSRKIYQVSAYYHNDTIVKANIHGKPDFEMGELQKSAKDYFTQYQRIRDDLNK